MSMPNDCLFRLLAYSSLSGIPPNSRKDWSVHFDFLHTLLCRSIHASFVDFLFCFHFFIKQQQKLTSFFTLKKMTVQAEKHEDRLDKDGGEAGELRNLFDDVCFSRFQYYHSLTQTIFEMTQFKMPCGTYDPL